ncbi:hypothetical protein [Neorhizobium sp. T25_13]|uniref:hypothetical protein n=1 Tax=Neorhizobium sp. T25_13 TaxID=2093830 RepID=UPI00155EAEA6|nr:hypothetical protein [Neorhizobium sp. T25_13]
MFKVVLTAEAEALLDRLARSPSTWPDNDEIVDLVRHRLIERGDGAYHATDEGREYLKQRHRH